MKSLTEYLAENKVVGNPSDKVNGFAILKPEFLDYESDFESLLTTDGWKIVKKKKQKLSQDQAHELYAIHHGKSFYNTLCQYMTSSECACYSCYKKCDDPIKDMKDLKDKVRKQWGKDEMKNAMHSSDSLENVKKESRLLLK